MQVRVPEGSRGLLGEFISKAGLLPDQTKVSAVRNFPTPQTRKQVKGFLGLTLRRLMSYIYMEHPFLMFLDHTQRRSTVGRTPLDE